MAVAAGAVGAGADALLDEDGAPQRSLFSWAEFMAGDSPDEPEPGKRRDGATSRIERR